MRTKDKKRRSRGFTLTEMIVVTLILSLISIAVSAGVSTSARTYQKTVEVSESEMLLSTLTQTVTDELRYARNIKTTTSGSGTIVSFDSSRYGDDVSFKAEDGQIKLGGYKMISSGAYSSGTNQTKNADIDVSWNDANKKFTVTIEILAGGRTLQSEELYVTPLN